jgi:hypothetical protein
MRLQSLHDGSNTDITASVLSTYTFLFTFLCLISTVLNIQWGNINCVCVYVYVQIGNIVT